MWSALTRRFLASTSFRLSATYAALLLLSFLVAATGAWFTTRSIAMREAGEVLSVAAADFIDETRGAGTPTLIAAINERMARHDDLLWRLSGADGGALAGEEALPAHTKGVVFADLPVADHGALSTPLADGLSFTVASNIERTEAIRTAVLASLFITGLAASLVALAVGVWITRRTLARMDGLADAARAFGAGDLAARAPLRDTASPDDLDELAAMFNAMLAQVDTLIANVQRVSADVAHDLRTPLTHLRQRLDLARADATPEQREASIDAAQASIDEVLRVFDAMLRLSAIEAAPARARFGPVDLARTLESVCDAYRPDIEASGRQLLATPGPPALVHGDAQLIAQAVSNLLENALRHTSPGAAIRARIVNDGDVVNLIIADNGPGIPASARQTMLQPFTRLDQSRSRPGSGLGLSIAAAVARRHGGEIALEDNAPGLRARLAFPRASA
ncbi:MAG: HAMP domain-containing histidine kinase [Hyphomonadaceae bacterium]|nr:HAMP domain-containing histidine kinase [Hyphomonadaceae bacterium]MBX3509649.1 HAMP domain-containing histidine kinase [Hyphomonadaceae bacterium]